LSKITAHFNTEEFACNCGCGKLIVDEDFVWRLEKARQTANIPFRITSGYRCTQHNEVVGGVDSSAHVKGKAVDLAVEGSHERYQILSALIYAGQFHRIGIGESFIHVDVDETKPPAVIWLY
jgi:zinc D-Ala-D-Ala carboxypeptidase